MARKLMMMIVVAAVLLTGLSSAAAAELFRLERMVIATAVVDREPVGPAESFAADLDRVYAFIEAREIREDTTVSFVWFHHGVEVAAVPLTLGQGPRWRTFSSISVRQRPGDWRVELRDQGNNTVQSAEFMVE